MAPPAGVPGVAEGAEGVFETGGEVTMPNPLTSEERARLIAKLRNLEAIHKDAGWIGVQAMGDYAAAELTRTADDARDAERYRWLRKHVKPWEGFDAGYPYCEIDIFLRELANGSVEKISIIGPRDAVGMASLDTAVDIAIASSKSEDRVKPVADGKMAETYEQVEQERDHLRWRCIVLERAFNEVREQSQREREQLQARVAGMEVAIRFTLAQNPVCSAGWIKVLNDALSPPAAPVQAEGEK